MQGFGYKAEAKPGCQVTVPSSEPFVANPQPILLAPEAQELSRKSPISSKVLLANKPIPSTSSQKPECLKFFWPGVAQGSVINEYESGKAAKGDSC